MLLGLARSALHPNQPANKENTSHTKLVTICDRTLESFFEPLLLPLTFDIVLFPYKYYALTGKRGATYLSCEEPICKVDNEGRAICGIWHKIGQSRQNGR